jgi:hypothetical protein
LHPTDLTSPARGGNRAGRYGPRAAALALAGPTGASSRRAATHVALLAGAALLAASALIHLYLWADGYRHIATIGPLFLAQAIVGLCLAVLLVAYPRVASAAAAGAYLVATIGAFTLSASVGLFGFQDRLDAPWARNALVVEVAGLVCLAIGAALPLQPARSPDYHRRRAQGTRERNEP